MAERAPGPVSGLVGLAGPKQVHYAVSGLSAALFAARVMKSSVSRGRANPVNAILLVPALWCVMTLAITDDSYFPIKTKAGDEGVTAFEAQ
jgi:hypothetical protein